MTRIVKSTKFFGSVFFILLGQIQSVSGAEGISPVERIRLSYTSITPSGAPLWLPYELGLFKEEGLNAELIYVNSATRALSALFAGQTQFTTGGVSTTIQAYLSGGDPVAIAGTVNKMNVSIFSVPEVLAPSELKGKKLGITRLGGLYDFAANYALKKWGLATGRDVVLIQIGEVPAIMAALESRAIHAAVLTIPFTVLASQKGYRELIDLSKSDLEFQNTVILSTRSLIKKSPDTFRKFMRAYSRGLAAYHTQKDATLRVLARYIKGIDPYLLEKSYEAYQEWIPKIPYVNHAGMETAINLTLGTDKTKRVKVEEVLDESFVKDLDKTGFYKQPYRSY
jgi:ABC-type nitrate/sulfonate/bicarbonate transport system substrate-binding protein